MANIAGWVGLLWLLSASALAQSGGAGGFDAPPPPPPPAAGGQMPPVPGAAPVAPLASVNTPESSAASRYQICFQRMVDAGVNDNAFMKKCLGIPIRSQTQTSNYAPMPPPPQAAAARRPAASRADLAAVVQQNLGGLTDCYDNLLAQSRDLGLTPGGLVGALVELQASGQAQVLALDPQSLPDLSLLNCFRSRIRSWAFPHHGERVRFYLAFALVAKTPQKGSVTLSRGYPQIAPSIRPRGP